MGMLHRHKMRLREEAEKQTMEQPLPSSVVAEGQDITEEKSAKPKRTRKKVK